MKFTEECVSTEKHIFVKRNVYKCAKHGFSPMSLSQKDSPWSGTHTFSGKENVLSATVNKESHADCVLGHKRSHHYWFPWKSCSCKQCFQMSTPWAKFTLFLEWPSY